MKKILIVAFIILSNHAFSQFAYVGIGYNLASGSYDSLNYVIQRYNETRSFLTTEMDELHFTKGMCYSFGLGTDNILFETGIQYNRAKTHAIGVDVTNTEQRREVKLRLFSYYMDLGVPIPMSSVTVAPGIGFNVMGYKYKTRSGLASNIKEYDWYTSDSDLSFHFKIFTKIFLGELGESGSMFMIEPYYMFGIFPVDVSYNNLNQTINSNTWKNEMFLDEKFSFGGVKLMLTLQSGG